MIAVITDTHFGAKSFDKQLFQTKMEYFNKVFFPYLIENNITDVLHLGDMVHNRNFIDLFILQELKAQFFQWFEDNKVTLHCLIGNHDTFFKSHIKHNFQTANLNEYKYVNVIEKQTNIVIDEHRIGFVPWITEYQNLSLPDPKNVDILCGHFELENFLMHGNFFSKGGMSPKKLEDYKLVLSGHYHAHSRKNNIMYIGTQYQTNWGDYNNKKGFFVINEDLSTKYVENVYSPKFLRLYYKEHEDGSTTVFVSGDSTKPREVSIKEASELSKKNNVKFIIKEYKNQLLMSKVFDKISKSSLNKIDVVNESSVLDTFDQESFNEEVSETIEISDVVRAFVDNAEFGNDIQPEVVKEKLNFLLNKAKENY